MQQLIGILIKYQTLEEGGRSPWEEGGLSLRWCLMSYCTCNPSRCIKLHSGHTGRKKVRAQGGSSSILDPSLPVLMRGELLVPLAAALASLRSQGGRRTCAQGGKRMSAHWGSSRILEPSLPVLSQIIAIIIIKLLACMLTYSLLLHTDGLHPFICCSACVHRSLFVCIVIVIVFNNLPRNCGWKLAGWLKNWYFYWNVD